MLTRRQILTSTAAAMTTHAIGTAAFAQATAPAAWPNRPVKVIVPYPPAGGADTTARLLFTKLGQLWNQQFVIDNRGGAGGTIGEAAAAKSDPDGYTILHDATAFSVNPALYSNLSFSYAKDFQPVFLASLVPNILVVNKNVPDNTLADVIAAAKKTPGGLDFASSGNGTLQHLCLEMLKHLAKVPINHVPYRAGTVKAIVHTGKGRLGTLPDLPAAQDTIPGFEGYEWNCVFVPAGTSPDIVKKLNAGLNEVLRQPDIIARLKQLNIEYRQNTPEEFRAFVAVETEKWGKVVRDAGIKLG